MVKSQFYEGNGKWTDIPTAGVLTPEVHERLAYEYCKQSGITTRIVDDAQKNDKGNIKVVKEFKCQKR